MTHRVCCSIWHSSWHFNRLFQWLYLYIRYSHHTYILSFQLKRLPVSDLVRSIEVCQTDAHPSAKLLPRTAEAVSHLFHENRMADIPTPEVSVIRMSSIEIKTLIAFD